MKEVTIARRFSLIASKQGFQWDPRKRRLLFDPRQMSTPAGRTKFLHELAHGLLQHTESTPGREDDAWVLATKLSGQLGIDVDEPLLIERLSD